MPLAVGDTTIRGYRLGAADPSRIYHGAALIYQRPTVDPANLWKAPQQVDAQLATYPELQPIADQPQGRWVLETTTATDVQGYVTAAAGKTMLLVIYAIPGRDSGGYSAGGFPDRASYLSWLTGIRDAVGSAPAMFVYEPDALGLANGMTAEAKAERIETLRLGVGILAGALNAETYIDASRWIAVLTQADLLRLADVYLIKGFSQNVSAYDAQADLYTYGDAVVTELGNLGIAGKVYVNDTSRNANGPLTTADSPLADPWLNTNQAWCNPPKRAIGLTPRVSTHPGCRAELWIKAPGESDGAFPTLTDSDYYGESAPSAGTFWVPNARDLLGLHTPPGGSTTTGTVSDVKANFDVDFGPFTNRSAGATLATGRARIPVNTGFENIQTAATYTLQGGTVHARMYPGAANGTTGEASIIFAVNSPTSGTRIVAGRIDAAKGSIQFAAEVDFFDPNNVTITYDPTAHSWVRIREAAGSLFWETSPDAVTWTQQKTAPTPAWITATQDSSVQFVTHRDAGTEDFAEVDAVNT